MNDWAQILGWNGVENEKALKRKFLSKIMREHPNKYPAAEQNAATRRTQVISNAWNRAQRHFRPGNFKSSPNYNSNNLQKHCSPPRRANAKDIRVRFSFEGFRHAIRPRDSAFVADGETTTTLRTKELYARAKELLKGELAMFGNRGDPPAFSLRRSGGAMIHSITMCTRVDDDEMILVRAITSPSRSEPPNRRQGGGGRAASTSPAASSGRQRSRSTSPAAAFSPPPPPPPGRRPRRQRTNAKIPPQRNAEGRFSIQIGYRPRDAKMEIMDRRPAKMWGMVVNEEDVSVSTQDVRDAALRMYGEFGTNWTIWVRRASMIDGIKRAPKKLPTTPRVIVTPRTHFFVKF